MRFLRSGFTHRQMLWMSLAGVAAGASLLVACVGLTQQPPTVAAAASPAPAPEPAVSGALPTLRLISESQYINTIQDVFGSDIAIKVRFASVKRTDGLVAVGASGAVVTPGALDPLDNGARGIAQQVVDPKHREFLIPCKPAAPDARDDACARRFLSRVGRLLYRRPMTEQELASKVDVAGQATSKMGDFYSGLAHTLSGMLVSPKFLYIQETVEPDSAKAGGWRLDGYSKASRLSLLLWDATPDDELLAAAAQGDLHQELGLRHQMERMLSSPLLERGVRAFFTDFLVLEDFDNLAKDPIIYPAFTLKVAQDAREQILRTVVDHLVSQKGDYRDLFTTRRAMLSADLAAIYQVPVDVDPSVWTSYEFAPGDPRAGILTQVSFLAQYAHPGRSSPTRRGRGIRTVLLCQTVPDPPPNVDFSNFEDPEGEFSTARERLTAHNTDPVCAGCHQITDPIGLGLENFDGAGQFRAMEKGALIDGSGVLDGVEYTDANGLGAAMREHPAVRSCIVNRLYAYGAGRTITSEEVAVMRYFETVLDNRGYSLNDMLRIIVSSKAFFAVKPAADTLVVAANGTLEKGPSYAHQISER